MKIAIVEDQIENAKLLAQALQNYGQSTHFSSGEQFLGGNTAGFDLIFLDWGLPGLQGIEVLRQLRQFQNTPVIFLTARTEEQDVVAALESGSDDFIVKPFRPAELMARVQAVMRRNESNKPELSNAVEVMPGLVLNPMGFSVSMPSGAQVVLTQKEFELASFFFRNLGKPLKREYLLHSVWGRGDSLQSRTLDTHISRLRAQLHLKPEHGWRLTPVYSYGYRLDYLSE